ncbi:MAG TPA: bifunctional phosphopantothenoylcysteine decarboxylase/phosphopantothenate--cysteine ligase CoaBC, partial [Thermoanaerobaculia bacterium]
GKPVHTEVWGDRAAPAVEHVALADWAELLVVAPATAHTIGKLAHGLADDFLSTYFLAHRAPVLLAPAMESAMWTHPAVRANVEALRARGARLVGPASGALASGHEGLGRMAEPIEIVEEAERLLSARRDLAGLRLLVTAGPTREPLDPVRYVSNRSSGRMGYALAESARDRGAAVTLLSGPTDLPRPEGARFFRFETAAELHALLVREFPDCDGLAMAAAVADFIPEESPVRLHREEGDRTVRLAAGTDILASLAPLKRGQTVIAFAAETEDFETRGRRKMEAKDADLVIVNDVGRKEIGFDSPDNEVWILGRDGTRELVTQRSKREVAEKIWDAFRAARAASAVGSRKSGSENRESMRAEPRG